MFEIKMRNGYTTAVTMLIESSIALLQTPQSDRSSLTHRVLRSCVAVPSLVHHSQRSVDAIEEGCLEEESQDITVIF